MPPDTTDVITVEGRVSVRGNMPLTALVLETEQRTLYVLVLDEADAAAWEPNLPARLRVTGHLYADDWNGFRYAHLRATNIERP